MSIGLFRPEVALYRRRGAFGRPRPAAALNGLTVAISAIALGIAVTVATAPIPRALRALGRAVLESRIPLRAAPAALLPPLRRVAGAVPA